MKSNLKLLTLALISLAFLTNAQAKTKLRKSDAGIRVGAAFGAPLGAMPSGASGLPLPAPSLGLFYTYKVSPKFSLQIGAETYSMKAKFETPYENFEYIGNIEKYINGNTNSNRIDTVFLRYAVVEDGKFNNRYLSIPITANYHFRKGWSMSFGTYVGYNFRKEMVGTATDIYFGDKNDENYSLKVSGEMPFNESDKIQNWDFGLSVGGNYELNSGINFDLRINTGLNDIFVKEFSADRKSVV